jgi:hypothetical protein
VRGPRRDDEARSRLRRAHGANGPITASAANGRERR